MDDSKGILNILNGLSRLVKEIVPEITVIVSVFGGIFFAAIILGNLARDIRLKDAKPYKSFLGLIIASLSLNIKGFAQLISHSLYLGEIVYGEDVKYLPFDKDFGVMNEYLFSTLTVVSFLGFLCLLKGLSKFREATLRDGHNGLAKSGVIHCIFGVMMMNIETTIKTLLATFH